MNKINRIKSIICLFLCMVLLSFAACGNNEESGKNSANTGDELTVTFDYNYDGAPNSITQTLTSGDVATEPQAPTREHYAFTGWYNDKNTTSKFDFEYEVTEDVTVYAGWRLSEVVVTFNYGYDDITSEEVISVGSAVGEPSMPSRDGYTFLGWYESETATTAYDFSTLHNADTTIYAKWDKIEEDGDYVTVTFLWNYDGSPDNGVYGTASTKKGRVLTSSLPQPSRGEKYYFYGWYKDADYTTMAVQTDRYSENTTLYARWYDRNTFEAEYTKIDDKTGAGYSGLAGGYSLIVYDKFNAETSKENNEGFFITYLYYNKASLEFYVYAEEDIDDAVLSLRLSCEIKDLYLTSEDFLVRVGDFDENGEFKDVDGNSLQETKDGVTTYKGSYSYDPIDIKITVEGAGTGYSDTAKQPFSDYLITTKMKLKKGRNIIQLMVNNDTYVAGTMYASAPIIDCIYIYSDKTVSWDAESGYPLESNLNYVAK